MSAIEGTVDLPGERVEHRRMRNRLLFTLCLGGAFASGYLAWSYASPEHPLACIGSGCDAVRASRYAQFLGLPLPLYGLAMFLVLALLSFGKGIATAPWARIFSRVIVLLSGAGFLAFSYLTAIEAFVLHAWCFWCVLAAVLGTGVFLLALLDQKTAVAVPGHARREARVLAAILAGFVAASAPGFYALTRAARQGSAAARGPALTLELTEEARAILIRPDSHRRGNSASGVTVVEFGDLQCSACRVAQESVRETRALYGDQVEFVFRHFPLPAIHAFAWKAAEASECAAEQGKFWEAVDYFFDHQNDLSPPALKRYAGAIGLDASRFEKCLDSGTMSARVARDLEDARALGLKLAPTFVIQGQVIGGAIPFARMRDLLDRALAARASAEPRPAGTAETTGPQPFYSALPGNASRSLGTEAPAFGSRPPGFGNLEKEEASCSEEAASQPEAPAIRLEEAYRAFLGGEVLFVDVREPDAFRAGHIRGSRNIPLGQVERRLNDLPRDQRIVLYDDDPGGGDACAASRSASRLFLSRGYSPSLVRVYRDGFTRWREAGYPTGP